MNTILYRLPEEKTVHELKCSRVVNVTQMEQLGHEAGYVFAPFETEGVCPTLLFIPDEEISWITPNRFTARHIEYTNDENRRHQMYEREFEACRERLLNGDVDKIVLSRGLKLQMDTVVDEEDLRNLFITAAHHYPHSFVSLVNYGDEAWLIATPEVLLEQKEGTLRTMALAATMSIEEGARLRPAQWTDKNCREQRIVADYIADTLTDLGIRFSASAVHTKIAGQLVHLCTDFSMDDTDDIGRIIAALHPTPAVCGLPAHQAAALIKEIEHDDRRYYAGFSGPIGLEAGTHLFVTLRCMCLDCKPTAHEGIPHSHAGTVAHLYAGGGLLAASDCESEWVETQRKLKTMLNVLQ